MARLNIIICDLCKNMSKVTLPFGITLQSGKGKNKELTKAEICQQCYDATRGRIESDFDLNNSFSSRPRRETGRPANNMPSPEKIEIADGESIVPSNVDNIAPPPRQMKCTHEQTSVIDNEGTKIYLKCKECGEEWEA